MARPQAVLLNAATITATGNGTGVQLQPWQTRVSGYLSVTGSVTGTTPSMTVTIQHSPDNSNWFTWAALPAFTAVTATSTFLYIVPTIDLPIDEYVRASYTVTGTTPSFAGVTVVLRIHDYYYRPQMGQ